MYKMMCNGKVFLPSIQSIYRNVIMQHHFKCRVSIYLWLLELDNFWCARIVPIMEFFFLKYLFLILLNFYLIILLIICSFCLQKFREKLPSYGKKEASISHANVLLSWIASSAKTSLLVFRFDLFFFLLLFAFLPHL